MWRLTKAIAEMKRGVEQIMKLEWLNLSVVNTIIYIYIYIYILYIYIIYIYIYIYIYTIMMKK